MKLILSVSAIFITLTAYSVPLPKAAGYRGIWYCNQKVDSPYVYKYSGGLGTYCAKHIPMAIYAPAADKTFFVYGGAKEDGAPGLLEMVSYYDHKTGTLPRPTILLDKGTEDAHDNPVISMDKEGHVFVFASSHGTARSAYVFKSTKPYDVNDFEKAAEMNFSYPQPWYIPEKGFLFLHTRYETNGRSLFWSTSTDGSKWTQGYRLARIGLGHYQVSWPCGKRVGTAFDYHPDPKGLNFRTNLYYIETNDMGNTWKTINGEIINPPLTDIANPALVHDYAADGLVVYVKDLNYDAQGRPVILHLVSHGWMPGPQNGPYELRLACWHSTGWEFYKVTNADHNYDTGSLYIEADGTWRVIAPTEPGLQPYGTGGDIAIWISKDEGQTWNKTRDVTSNSQYNHSHVRRPLNAHPDFYAFWADGDTHKPSDSHLYFCNQDGKKVTQLPWKMD